MSRQHVRKPYGGPKLPFELQQKFGSQKPQTKPRHRRTDVGDRKEQRQTLRVEKRNGKRQHDSLQPQHDDKSEATESEHEQNLRIDHAALAPAPRSQTKSRLKNAEKVPAASVALHVAEDTAESSRESSPEIVLDANSRSFKEREAQDDAEIRALEKRLGIKKGKKRKSVDDPLDDILDGLDDDFSNEETQRDEKEWLARKRRKSEALQDLSEDHSDGSVGHERDGDSLEDAEGFETGDDSLQSDSDEEFGRSYEGFGSSADEDEAEEDISDDGDFEGFDERGTSDDAPSSSFRVRENPYVPPTDTGGIAGKYVPPSLRKPLKGDAQSLERLRKQVQGQLNKLSEANIISILAEVEKLYQSNPRQDVTTTVIQLLLASFSARSALPNTFIILHAAFVAAIYKVVGIEFGAELVAKLVESFDKQHQDTDNSGKESLNYISLLANMFTFNVVSSGIIYDHIRLLLANFSESNAELLLRIVRDCGPQLRSDDPTALKSIVQMMQNTSAETAKQGLQPNIRTRVMIDAIIDLKNNKMKQATNAAGMTGEHLTRMRKVLGTLNNRQLRGTEPLRISREDIANSDKKGKWWLVGSSWKGSNDTKVNDQSAKLKDNFDSLDSLLPDTNPDPDEVDYGTLSRHYKMNTAIRRSIFVAITSASDASDALGRIAKLRLTRKQEPEIARVLLRCCRAEPTYNLYYSILAKNLLRENSRRFRMSFLIALWKFFEALGERQQREEGDTSDNDGENDDEPITMHELANTAKMYAFLLTRHSLDLFDLLKPLDIGMTRTQTTLWLELLFVSIFTAVDRNNTKTTATSRNSSSKRGGGDQQLLRIFSGGGGGGDGRNPPDPRIAKSLRYFLHKNVRRSDLVSDRQEKKAVQNGCKMAETILEMDVNNADVDMEMV